MVLANQHGWTLHNPSTVTVVWDGSEAIEGVTVSPARDTVRSHFGSGIVTWTLPYLFVTSRGFDLLVRGPANLPVDGASAMEGLVETDWAPVTATMNWKLTRPGLAVTFDAGQPIAMLVPVERGLLESFRPHVANLTDCQSVMADYTAWREEREEFLRNLAGAKTSSRQWQGDYFRGTVGAAKGGRRFHRTKLSLAGFAELADPDE